MRKSYQNVNNRYNPCKHKDDEENDIHIVPPFFSFETTATDDDCGSIGASFRFIKTSRTLVRVQARLFVINEEGRIQLRVDIVLTYLIFHLRQRHTFR